MGWMGSLPFLTPGPLSPTLGPRLGVPLLLLTCFLSLSWAWVFCGGRIPCMEAALWGPFRLGGAGVPKAGQSAVRELDGQGLRTGLRAFLPLLPEVCLGAQQVSTPPAPLTAAPLPPARNCLLFEGVGEQTPHGNVSPTPGPRSPCPSPHCWPGCSKTPPLPCCCPSPAPGWPSLWLWDPPPPRGGNPSLPCPACMTTDLRASLTSDLT